MCRLHRYFFGTRFNIFTHVDIYVSAWPQFELLLWKHSPETYENNDIFITCLGFKSRDPGLGRARSWSSLSSWACKNPANKLIAFHVWESTICILGLHMLICVLESRKKHLLQTKRLQLLLLFLGFILVIWDEFISNQTLFVIIDNVNYKSIFADDPWFPLLKSWSVTCIAAFFAVVFLIWVLFASSQYEALDCDNDNGSDEIPWPKYYLLILYC